MNFYGNSEFQHCKIYFQPIEEKSSEPEPEVKKKKKKKKRKTEGRYSDIS